MSRRWFSGGFAGVVGLDKHRTGKTRLFRSEGSRLSHTVIFHDLWGLAFPCGSSPLSIPHGSHSFSLASLNISSPKLGLGWMAFFDSQAIAEVAMERVPHLKEGRAIHLVTSSIQTFLSSFHALAPPWPTGPFDLALWDGSIMSKKELSALSLFFSGPSTTQGLIIPWNSWAAEMLKSISRGCCKKAQRLPFTVDSPEMPIGAFSHNGIASLYTSDFEGSPLAMQEALNAGCLPIYPRIHSVAIEWFRKSIRMGSTRRKIMQALRRRFLN